MKIDLKSELAPHIQILDQNNQPIQGVFQFDTVTKNAGILLFSTNKSGERQVAVLNKKPKKVYVKLAGAKAVDKRTGEEIK